MQENKTVMGETFKAWTPLATAIIILTVTAYVIVQQDYRMSANDQLVQGVEDVLDQLGQGRTIDSMLPPTGTTELNKTLDPFALAFDESGKLTQSSAILNGKNPSLPFGTLEAAKKAGQPSRITWQPQPGLRFATIIAHFASPDGKQTGYFVVGKSLREVEQHIDQEGKLAAGGGLIALILTFLITWVVKKSEFPKVEIIETKPETEPKKA